METIAARLGDTPQLLLLDNFEQLLPGAPFVAELLARVPGTLVLATSRSPLRLQAEQEYPVPPFEAPDASAPFEEVVENDAVRLFAQRARAISADFRLTDENVPGVAAICARLDGLPLAIELAAARTRLLPPEAIASRLGSALDLLAGGARDAPPRHRTLRATLDWSYETLPDEARALLPKLSVFAGCSLGAIEAVCGSDSLAAAGTLVEASLLRAEEGADRFAMLETIREYAGELLAGTGDRDELRARHCRYFLGIAEAGGSVLAEGGYDEALYEELDREHDNLRAALDWAAESGDLDLELRLLEAVRYFWVVRGHLREGRSRFERAIAAAREADALTRARVLVRSNVFHYRLGDIDTAARRIEEALDLFRELGDLEGITWCTADLGTVAMARNEHERARAFYEEAARGLERLGGNPHRIGIVKANLAVIADTQGDLHAALAYGGEAAAMQEEAGDVTALAITLHNLGRTYLQLGERDEGRAHLRRSLELACSLGYRQVVAYVLEAAAEIAVEAGDERRALALLAASEAGFAELGMTMQGEEGEQAKRLAAGLERSLGREAVAGARAAAAAAIGAAVEDARALLLGDSAA